MIISNPKTRNLKDRMKWLAEKARRELPRSMRQFAEEEIVIPEGEYEDQKYSVKRQPYTRFWFDAIDKHGRSRAGGKYNRFAGVGPTQSGKTLTCFCIPILYHLFEIGETTVAATPKVLMNKDKWEMELLPVIRASQYRRYLPITGRGSKGGVPDEIHFTNGSTLKFMTGGGDDKTVAGFTTRVMAISEVDGMDEAGQKSREADRVTQLEARTRHYRGNKRIYLECTASIEEGRIWQEFWNGSRGQIVCKCPHCSKEIVPLVFKELGGKVVELKDVWRESLVGWQEADNEIDAGEKSAWFCPLCGEQWTQPERYTANLEARIQHNNEMTRTYSMRWNAFNNFFDGAIDIGQEEWKAVRSDSPEEKEKELCQFTWGLPYFVKSGEVVELSANYIRSRITELERFVYPEGATAKAVGIDVAKRWCHYTVMGVEDCGRTSVVDYGVREVHSDEAGFRRAFLATIRDFDEELERDVKPDQCWIDSRWYDQKRDEDNIIHELCKELGVARWKPIVGIDTMTFPDHINKKRRYIGNRYLIDWIAKDKTFRVTINSDYWRNEMFERLILPLNSNFALALFNASTKDHLSFAKHLTADVRREEFIPGKGFVVRWQQIRTTNHYGDSTYICLVATDFILNGPESYEVRTVPSATVETIYDGVIGWKTRE
jgi:hypothetical protein